MDHPRFPYVAVRIGDGPLLTPASHPSLGDNLNGPSPIRVPDWLDQPPGRYLLYFAHHRADRIRLAHAEHPAGPWTVHAPGALRLDQAPLLHDHVASPDVHVDHARRRIVMYAHGPVAGSRGQMTIRAESADGIRFTTDRVVLGPYYFRVFVHGGCHYALWKNGNTGWGGLSRSPDGIRPFVEERPQFLEGMRHAAVRVDGDRLLVVFTRVGDAPERLLGTVVDLRGDWRRWTPGPTRELLAPERDYEGARFPVRASEHGAGTGVRELRDPGLLADDGRLWLYYSVAGESGIALAALVPDPAAPDRG